MMCEKRCLWKRIKQTPSNPNQLIHKAIFFIFQLMLIGYCLNLAHVFLGIIVGLSVVDIF
ncbi:hypothetical protein DRO31_08525 [Candidatus Bathyarchaeota archaeon]|nr:MAG: hypothetical protein DRO31_08525 [Candidatus Bathyarchaeota archaeon]